MKSRSPLLLATTLAGVLAGCSLDDGGAPGADGSDGDPDDLPALSLERAELAGVSALAPGVIGMQSSGVPNPMNAVDGDGVTSTTVDSVVGHCPLHNNGPFIKLAGGQCLGPSTTYFHGWEMVTFQLGNNGNVDAVDLNLSHGRAGLSQNLATTLVYTSWDGRAFSYAGAYTATSTMATRTIRVVPPSRPATSLIVVLGKSTATPPPPAGPTLRWYELSAISRYTQPGWFDVVNDSQVDLIAMSLDGVRRNPDQVTGRRATFNVAPGVHTVGAAMGFGPSAGPAAGARICDWTAQATVGSGQTVTRFVPALTAGQVLTHCGTFIDYDGNYADLSGFHTVRLRIHSSNRFDWWHDGIAQAGGTIVNNLFLPPSLSFQLSSGDLIDTGWPFGSFTIQINGAPVLLLRATGW